MIKLEVEKKEWCRDSFLISTDEPARISVDVSNTGHMVVYAYKGTEIDLDQDPSGMYDSDSNNFNWTDEDTEVISVPVESAKSKLSEEDWNTLKSLLKKATL